MVGHARLACNESGHWLGGLARVEQVGQREEVKVAASENRSLSESVRASGEFWSIYSTRVKGGGLGVLFICFINVNGRWRAQSHPGGHTSPNEPPTGATGVDTLNVLQG